MDIKLKCTQLKLSVESRGGGVAFVALQLRAYKA